jgi:phosphatidylglycerophosphate synthase
MRLIARPVAALGVPPTAISLTGVLAASAAIGLVAFPLVAAVLVVIAVICDGVDGAVALIAKRASAKGALIDAVCDRTSELACTLIIWRCGAPVWLALLAFGSTLLLESGRVAGIGRNLITVAERPTRTICTVVALICLAVSPASWPASVCAGVWLGLGVCALLQVVLRQRGLRGQAGPISSATIAAERVTNGRPPPGWVEPPTR